MSVLDPTPARPTLVSHRMTPDKWNGGPDQGMSVTLGRRQTRHKTPKAMSNSS